MAKLNLSLLEPSSNLFIMIGSDRWTFRYVPGEELQRLYQRKTEDDSEIMGWTDEESRTIYVQEDIPSLHELRTIVIHEVLHAMLWTFRLSGFLATLCKRPERRSLSHSEEENFCDTFGALLAQIRGIDQVLNSHPMLTESSRATLAGGS